jgi:hypothetical protein
LDNPPGLRGNFPLAAKRGDKLLKIVAIGNIIAPNSYRMRTEAISKMRRWIILVLGAIFVVSVALLALFFRDVEQGRLGYEVAKALLQLGVVAIVGAVVSVLMFEYQRERQLIDKEAEFERQKTEKKADIDREENEKQRDLDRKRLEYREALLLSILSRAMDSYGRTKKARRLLRGRAVLNRNQVKMVLADQYDICFDLLNSAQLDLENIAREVRTSAIAFSKAKETEENLNDMDSYLNDLIGEYEDMRGQFTGAEPSLPLADLPRLEDFLRPARESQFKDGMVVPYFSVQSSIRKDLMHPNLIAAGGSSRPTS